MRAYPRRISRFFLATDLLALVILGSQIGLTTSFTLNWQYNLALAALCTILVYFSQFTEIAFGQVTQSLVDMVLVATLFLLPTPYPLLVAACGALPHLLRSGRQQPPEAVFNVALLVVRLGITGITVGLFVTPTHILDAGFVAGLPGMVAVLLVYFVLNSVQLALVTAVFRNCSPWWSYRHKVAPLWLIDSSITVLGLLSAVLWHYHPLSLLLLVSPILAFRATLQTFQLQSEARQAKEKSDQLQVILAASRELRLSEPSQAGLLQPMLAAARTLTGAPIAAAYILAEENTTALQRVAVEGDAAETAMPLTLPAPPAHSEILQQVTGNSVAMSIPLCVDAEERLVGLITLHGLKAHAPESQVQVLVALAGQAATVLENAALHARVLRDAVLDSLTGLYNRRSFERRLDEEIARAHRTQTPLSLLMVDLDNFGEINNTCGHAAGDEMLRVVGRVLRDHIRSMDIPARYGGDEFIALLPATQTEIAVEVGSRLCEAIKMVRLSWDEAVLTISASVGVATLPTHGDTGSTLRYAADMAAYTAKKLGKSQVCCPEDAPQAPVESYGALKSHSHFAEIAAVVVGEHSA